MPTPTYTPLANITLGGSAASVTFSDISQVYRDLVLIVTASSTGSALAIEFNGSTSGYSRQVMSGNGSVTSGIQTSGDSYASLNRQAIMDGATASFQINIMDYSATDKHKNVLNIASKAGSGVDYSANRWANTAAITSVKVTAPSWNLNAGSTFALYGVTA